MMLYTIWLSEQDYVLCRLLTRFLQAMQKVYEWRSHFSAAAMAAIDVFWASDDDYDDKDTKAAYVEYALGPSLPFMFSNVDTDDDGNVTVGTDSLSTYLILTLTTECSGCLSIGLDSRNFCKSSH